MSCRPSNKLSSTSLMSLQRGLCIKERWRKQRPQWCLTSLRTVPSPHHHQDPSDLPTVLPSLPTTVLTWHSSCSAPTTPYSPAPCTFSHRGSVQFLSMLRVHSPADDLSTKLSAWGRAPTPCSTTSLRTMGWTRREYTCMPTTVVGRTKTL